VTSFLYRALSNRVLKRLLKLEFLEMRVLVKLKHIVTLYGSLDIRMENSLLSTIISLISLSK
jgi:hypothetical protein